MAETKTVYIVHPLGDVKDLAGQTNIILAQLADRLDALEGRRGTPTFYSAINLQGNPITNMGSGTNPSDAADLAALNAAIAGLNAVIAGLQRSLGTAPHGEVLCGDLVWAKPPVENYMQALGGNVSMPSANAWYDGPSLALSAGTWLVSGQVTCNLAGAGNFSAVLWDGTTSYASSPGVTSVAAPYCVCPIAPKPIVLAAGTTLKISCACDAINGAILAALGVNPEGNTASYISAIRLA